ncbi:MAG: S-layer homology domain-containing protein [Clostridia bacterium]|nr:S-layer homology domain-containing protein [Clostridia bacterium]
MRKFLALVLSFILTVGAVSTVASAAKFTDVSAKDETLTKAVDLLSSVGITTGTTATTFGTSEGVTRQQMATFIYRLMKAGKTVEGKEGDNSTTFTDLDDPFYYFMISWANDSGIIKGRNATTFDPKGGIILQDAYVMLVRALGYEKKDALGYPFDYITIAEKIGLDDGLPSNVNYDTALTRGNVAVLLYNAFYADMATGETAYEIEYEEVVLTSGKHAIVEKAQTPYTIYDTVAQKVFGLKKTVQRVVATPNYCIDEFEKTDDAKDDMEMISVACFDEDYIDTDSNLFDEIAFDTLGLAGKADDYFLIDLSIYYKKEENKAPEIIAATALGTYKADLPGSKVKFDASNQNLAYQGDGNVKAATGKVTIDGQVSYLFNAPWTYSKPANMEDKDKECITLLWLDATERDPEEEDYVMDYNFKSNKDVLGRGKEAYNSIPEVYEKTGGKWVRVSESMVASDLRGYGIYSTGGMAALMQIMPSSTNFEADAWDSNGDGKYDYLWLKPYTIGQVCEEEGESLMDMHASGLDTISAVYESREVPTIYTYGATKEGADFKDKQLITAYINGPANYIKCSTAIKMEYTENQVYDKYSSEYTFGFNGSSTNRTNMARHYVGYPDKSGARMGITTGRIPTYLSSNFSNITFGKTYDIVFVGNAMFHVKGSAGAIDEKAEYAMIFPNTNGAYAFTTSVGIVEDGNLQKSGNMLEALIEGELVDVVVKPQTSDSLAARDPSMPVTPKQKNGVYDFSDYVGKLLTYTVNSDDQYVFKIAPMDANTDVSVLKTDELDTFYTYESDVEGKVTSAFVKSSGNLYQFLKKDGSLQTQVAPSKFVTFGENTKVVIKTYNDEDEPVFTIYDNDNRPNFDTDDEFKNIKYIVKNNPKSTSMEDLVYLYAEAADGTTGIKTNNTLDYRFVKATKMVKVDDSKVVYYDVYNPFKGTIEEEYEAVSDADTVVCDINGIYTVSNGYLDDEEGVLGYINDFGAVATSDAEDGLGLVAIGDFDKETGILSIEDEDLLFMVDEDTIITFLDLDEETIELKTSSILTSTSKNYRCNDDKNMPLLAFVASSEIKKEDEFEHAEVICIVRCDDLAK